MHENSVLKFFGKSDIISKLKIKHTESLNMKYWVAFNVDLVYL